MPETFGFQYRYHPAVPARTAGIRTSRAIDIQVVICLAGVERPLDSHRYKVGQSVRYTSNMLRYFQAAGEFRVVKLLPADGNEQQYRIKSNTEPHERVAKESQLDIGALSNSMTA